jgi:hypothetical protein
MVRSGPSSVAVCVLRVESHEEMGVLITVTTTFDVRERAPGRRTSVTGFDEALELVADFLHECEHGKIPGNETP